MRKQPQPRSRRKRLKSRSAGSVSGFSEIPGSSTPSYASLRHGWSFRKLGHYDSSSDGSARTGLLARRRPDEGFRLVTCRLGYAADNWLIFAKGGGDWRQGSSSSIGVFANSTFIETTSSSTNCSG